MEIPGVAKLNYALPASLFTSKPTTAKPRVFLTTRIEQLIVLMKYLWEKEEVE